MLAETHAPCYKWFGDGALNAPYSRLDPHVAAGWGERGPVIYEAARGTGHSVPHRQAPARRVQPRLRDQN
ncbi:hypothetical protein CF642_38345, partial [Burkholderia pseudomallei]